MKGKSRRHDALTRVLETYRDPETTDFGNAWVGMEPTFQTKKSVRKWKRLSVTPEGEDAYFRDNYMLRTERKVAKAMKKHYRAQHQTGEAYCLFARVELDEDLDQWQERRQKLHFHWADDSLEPFVVGFGLDPETFEYGIKPVPLAWFYDDRFVTFLEEFVWKVPCMLGLSCAIGHGGGQFHLSAKTFLGGSLLADDIAYKLNHPELASWIMDYPQPDDRAFRATKHRLGAFQKILQHYWAGRFHPRAIGGLTPENAYRDHGFGPALSSHKTLMDLRHGPIGDAREVFQTNFAFGRAVRWQAQNAHPGYWQSAHPDEEGYRPDQIMRYSEGNLNRLEIAGELHVKSDKVIELERVPEFDAPLEIAMLATEASWENRAQMSRTSARDYVEAVLLDVHHAQYLQAHPHVSLKESLLQDQIMGDAEATIARYGGTAMLDKLHREARALNLEASYGRIKSDWIEPEALFWASWRVLPAGEKAAIADEVISGFLERVEQAATMDTRPRAANDPMEWHRHRIHPVLWAALEATPVSRAPNKVRKELRNWQARKKRYLARRPQWSQDEENIPPWQED